MQTTRVEARRSADRHQATRIASLGVLWSVDLFAAWTLAYHAVLTSRAAAWLTLPITAVVAVAVYALRRTAGFRELRGAAVSARATTALLILATGAATFSLVIARPDADDFDVFQRALVQARRLSQPFDTTNTALNEPGLPAISPLHTATSYEPLAAIVPAVVGRDPLWTYQNGMAALAAALLPLVYFFLYREMRVPPGAALAGVCGVVAFLLLDGNAHRSFGNMAFVRLWQGKAIFWTLGIPLTLLLGLRFMRRPTRGRWLDVASLAVCAVGLTNSGVYLFPVLAAVLAGTGLALKPSPARTRSALLLAAAAAYPAAVAVLVLTGIIQPPADLRFLTEGWPPTWGANLALVVDSPWTLLRDLVLLVGLPLACLRRRGAMLLVGLTVSLSLTVANPVVGPLWLHAVLPSSYWRFAYLFPVPLAAGLTACALTRIRTCGARAAAGAAAGVVVVALALSTTTLDRGDGTFLKRPADYRLAPDAERCVAPLRKALRGRSVLAAEPVVVVLGLLEPDVRFEAVRAAVTIGAFQNAHRGPEGERRLAAQRWTTTGSGDPATQAAVSESLRSRVNAVVTRRPLLPQVRQAVYAEWNSWSERSGGGDCVALVRDR